ncbi:MAG: M3 family metallopeptidase [Planctomycetota bacterium]|nr:M3 family metallopeptidase [Planctomycetota bacterium]
MYKDNVKVITSILNNLVRDHANEGGLRKYPSAMTPAYLRDQVDKETIDNLMAVVEKNYDLAQRYYALKKKILGYEKMFGWDRSAPVGREHKMKWDEAREKVTKSYTMFDKEVGEHAKKFFERNWIDAEVRKGKRGGAFCSGTLPDLNPVVLMSFADNVRDTFTLAHEIGHGIHDIYAAQKQECSPTTRLFALPRPHQFSAKCC